MSAEPLVPVSIRASAAVLKAAQIFAWLASRSQPFSIGDLARECEVSHRTAYRWLCACEITDYVACDRRPGARNLYRSRFRIAPRYDEQPTASR